MARRCQIRGWIHSLLDWEGAIAAIERAHKGPRPNGTGFFLGDTAYGLLARGVIQPGAGAGLKLASICDGNRNAVPPRPTEDAAFIVIDETSKAITAILDGPAITRWKTPADSALAARLLSREESKVLLVLGAGPSARALIDAYLYIRPAIREVLLWNRTPARLLELQQSLRIRGIDARIVEDLDAAVARADIISAATSSSTPLIDGSRVKPGAHVDLLGGYRADMREVSSAIFPRARVFVDDRGNALASGDLSVPIEEGVFNADQIEADLHALCQQPPIQRSATDITLYKNAGGAHIDLAVSQHVVRLLQAREA